MLNALRRIILSCVLLASAASTLWPAPARAQAILPDCFGSGVEQSYKGVTACLATVGDLAITWVLAIALIALMATGYLYVTSMGNKAQAEQAKNSLIAITIGIIVVLGAYMIVSTLSNYFLVESPTTNSSQQSTTPQPTTTSAPNTGAGSGGSTLPGGAAPTNPTTIPQGSKS